MIHHHHHQEEEEKEEEEEEEEEERKYGCCWLFFGRIWLELSPQPLHHPKLRHHISNSGRAGGGDCAG